MSTAERVAPISQDCSDSDLVAAVRRGSDAAFEELYSRYSSRIAGYVRGMVTDHGRAEDITQEIFIAALRRMRETERPIAFKPWIYEIAKNACIDSFRRTRRAQEVSLDADDSLSSADRGRLTVVTTPDSALDSKQALIDLRGAFGGLSDSHHEILVLRELEGRSYSDIGERLGMSRPMVESTLFRARRRLAEEYDELVSGRRCEFVRNMVDSGPHYSLGIRDRRRIARHLLHCQPCRAHARVAGFDESILNMPSVGSKLAALLPIPLLRARFGSIGGLGFRGRSLLGVHALARSSDQLATGFGAGRDAAAAAAIVLAGVGGGIVTVTAASPAGKAPHAGALHAAPYPAAARRPGAMARAGSAASKPSSASAKKTTASRTGASHKGGSGPGSGSPTGASTSGVRSAGPAPPAAGAPAPAPSSVPDTPGAAGTSGSGVPTVTGNDGAGAPTNPGTGGGGLPTVPGTGGVVNPPSTGTGSLPTGTGSLPTGTGSGTPTVPGGTVDQTTGSLPTSTLPGLGSVTGSPPQLPVPGPGQTGSSAGGSATSTLGGVATGLGHLIGHR